MPLSLLVVGGDTSRADAPSCAIETEHRPTLEAAAARLGERNFDVLLVHAGNDARFVRLLQWPSLAQAVRDTAVVVCAPADDEMALRLVAAGVQDVRPPGDDPTQLCRALRIAVERHRRMLRQREGAGGLTDLDTGLPMRSQLLEHMTQLLALREREPAPMAVIALRLHGLGEVERALGAVSMQVLKRKAAVRLRAGLRASDVVASVDDETFVVLLSSIDAPGDGARVVDKLVAALQRPLRVAGHEWGLRVGGSVALYPEQGRDADSLLRVAVTQAAQARATSARDTETPAANNEA